MSKSKVPHVRLEFDRLVREYLENLNVALRSFKPAEEFDFLETWVPNDDPTEALLELVELGREAALDRLTLCVERATFGRLDLTRLEAAGPFTRREAGEQLELDFVLAEEALEIHPSYHTRLREVLNKVRHEQDRAPSDGEEWVAVTVQGVTLLAVVEPARRTVTRAAFRGAATPVQRGLMEALCATLEQKPILECADHAVIYVEHRLRDSTVPPPVPGVVTPENADPAFALPQQLVRALLAEYRARTGYRETKNFYDRSVAPSWAHLTDPQRCVAVRQALESLPVAAQLEVVGMDGPKRVVVRFLADLDSVGKQAVLAQLDAFLRQTVEPTLQLVAQTKMDANVVRLLEKKKNP